MNDTIDPTALSLSRAIRQAEGGDYTNSSGDASTSAGAYQWNNGKIPLKAGDIPARFKSDAQQVGLNPDDFSPTNQDHVGYEIIKKKLDSGQSQSSIAAEWNSGLTHGWENHKGTTVINGKTISYDTPAYVERVKNYYLHDANQSNSGLTSPLPAAPTPPKTAPPPVDQQGGLGNSILHGIGDFAKGITAPVATMLARPIQAGAELLGASPEQVNAASAKVPIYGSNGALNVPQNASDVGKDVGRGIETAALGLGPVAGGAAFGLGNSLEQGNPLLSGQTIGQTALGAAGGKVLDVASPLLGGIGKAILPKLAKDAAGKVGEAVAPIAQKVSNFAEKTPILPKGASDLVNGLAGGVNAAPGAVGKTVANQYGMGAGTTRTDALNAVSKALGESGKKSAGVFAKVDEAKLTGLENMATNADKVKLTDGSTYDPTTANLHQNVEALNQLKQDAYSSWTKEVEQATGAGVQVDTEPVAAELETMAARPGNIRLATQAKKVAQEIHALQGNPTELQAYLQTLNNGLKGVFSGGAASAERDVDAIAVNKLNDALDRSVIDITNDSMPIRKAKDLYSSYKAVEDGLVKKAQQAARKPDGGMGGGLYDYINPFNIADAFDAFTHPVGALKAGARILLGNKARAAKDPEKILQGIFQTIHSYKGIGSAPTPNMGTLQALKNGLVGGGIKTAFPQNGIANTLLSGNVQ